MVCLRLNQPVRGRIDWCFVFVLFLGDGKAIVALSVIDSVQKVIRSKSEDHRIPVVVMLGASLTRVCDDILSRLAQSDLAGIVVFSNATPPQNSPDGVCTNIRFQTLDTDELQLADGCLCCSMRSELAALLSRLFLATLRREQPPVSAVVIVSAAAEPDALEQTLKHAPFLSQRYRLALCLPLKSA